MTDDNSHMRDYVILRRDAGTDLFEMLPTPVSATSAVQAARRAADMLNADMLEAGVELVAVPTRSFTVVTVRLERQTRLVTS